MGAGGPARQSAIRAMRARLTPRTLRAVVPLAVLGVVAALAACASQADDPQVRGWVQSLIHPTRADDEKVAQQIQARLQAAAAPKGSGEAPRIEKALGRFYLERGFRPAWSDGGRLVKAVPALLEELGNAGQHGLDPADYEADRLAVERLALDEIRDPALLAARLADLDIELSRTWLRYTGHLSAGRLDPRRIGLQWHAEDERADPSQALAAVAESRDVKQTLAGIAPATAGYARLRDALARYRELGAAALPPPDPGEESAVREHLLALGDLRAADTPLESGLRAFQLRHGLEPTGELDKATRAALAVPVAARAQAIELNLERWRWLPPSIPERYLMVNIPDFGLQVVERDRPVLAMKVVVGKTASQTPVMSDMMTTLVLNPYWNVPEGIANNEIWPEQAKDPTYLQRHNMEVVTQDGVSRIRQRPGPGNALGDYKFVFPNHLNVYLHDTPADKLFERAERDFSHGCVRVERPAELAEYVLRGKAEWPAERVQDTLADGREVHVALEQPLPVYIVYFTAWVDVEGRVHFRDDVYGQDEKLGAALAERRRAHRSPAAVAAR
jgi:murein L,D-transpeptidase YcbB/YkuD